MFLLCLVQNFDAVLMKKELSLHNAAQIMKMTSEVGHSNSNIANDLYSLFPFVIPGISKVRKSAMQ